MPVVVRRQKEEDLQLQEAVMSELEVEKTEPEVERTEEAEWIEEQEW